MNNWYRFRLGGLNSHLILTLMKDFENFGDINKENLIELNYSKETIDSISSLLEIDLEDEKEKYKRNKVRILSYNSDEYPRMLKEISNPPPFLYVKGNGKFSNKSLAVVGTRKISSYGKLACDKIVSGFNNKGITIVSGLALGVDTYAHEIALKGNSSVIGVVAQGLDIIYPPSNARLYKEVEEKGLLISEYPLGTHPMPFTFPQRNRIIVGLTKGVLVVESFKRGGSLITAKLALDEGRDIFACPGFVTYPSFEGCNELIKNSEAKLTDSALDILNEYGWENEEIVEKSEIALPNAIENGIYKELTSPKTLDELVVSTKIIPRTLLVTITEMELKGLIKSVSGGRFVRV
jgi:DNA processing protein